LWWHRLYGWTLLMADDDADIKPQSLVEMQALETYYAAMELCYRDPQSGECTYCGPARALTIRLSGGIEPHSRPCKVAVGEIVRALLYAASGRKHG
jgi:hypothetical protein